MRRGISYCTATGFQQTRALVEGKKNLHEVLENMYKDIASNITFQSVTHAFLEVKITILNKSAKMVTFLQRLLFLSFLSML